MNQYNQTLELNEQEMDELLQYTMTERAVAV